MITCAQVAVHLCVIRNLIVFVYLLKVHNITETVRVAYILYVKPYGSNKAEDYVKTILFRGLASYLRQQQNY